MTVDYFVKLSQTTSPQTTEEFVTMYHRLIADGKKKDADQLRDGWSKQAFRVSLSEPQGAVWAMIAQPAIELALLPACSFFLSFTFTLAKPYLSKDDRPFYIIDNPIVREKVFRLPMVRATSWKGNLHSALWQLGHDKRNDEPMQRLFGDIRSEESGQAGRLFFYPTFFTQTSLEIINPHDRKRRVGKNPILFESIPADVQGVFNLLYVPFDRIGQDETETRRQAAEDLRLTAKGLQAMFLTYGFSAKRTSGYGTAEDRLVGEGKLVIRAELAGEAASAVAPPEPQQPDLPRYLESPTRLHADLRRPDGSLKSEAAYQALIESRGQKYGKRDEQLYAKAKGWWEREGKALTTQPPEPTQSQTEAAPPAPPWIERAFDSFDQLCEEADEAAQALQAGGAA